MKKHLNIILEPTDIRFTGKCIEIIDPHIGRYQLPYEDIVQVSLRVYKQESKDWYEPEIAEITKDMDGDLVICNRWQNHFVLRMDQTGSMAGGVLGDLTRYAPHALFGAQPWLEEYDDRQFKEALEMVDIMKECVDRI